MSEDYKDIGFNSHVSWFGYFYNRVTFSKKAFFVDIVIQSLINDNL